MFGDGYSRCDLGWRLGSVIVTGVLILAPTSLLASDWFFLFAIIGLVVNV